MSWGLDPAGLLMPEPRTSDLHSCWPPAVAACMPARLHLERARPGGRPVTVSLRVYMQNTPGTRFALRGATWKAGGSQEPTNREFPKFANREFPKFANREFPKLNSRFANSLKLNSRFANLSLRIRESRIPNPEFAIRASWVFAMELCSEAAAGWCMDPHRESQ